jgi:ABC-2 type transport system permease protein
MFPILRKEINSFLSSLVAYIIMALFLTGMGLFIWVFPDYNVLDYGYADLSTLFSMAPYIFMFLIPAVTMRSFAEEKKGGTLELLLTRPLTDWDIILGKYLACFLLILFTLMGQLGLEYHYNALSKGLIDSRNVIYFLSVIALALMATRLVLESRKW